MAATTANVDALSKLFQQAVEMAVTEKLKGKPPGKGMEQGDDFKNPFSKKHWNLTEQGKLLQTDPELAKRLMAAKGK